MERTTERGRYDGGPAAARGAMGGGRRWVVVVVRGMAREERTGMISSCAGESMGA